MHYIMVSRVSSYSIELDALRGKWIHVEGKVLVNMMLRNMMTIWLALLGFALVHSLMAGAGLKSRLQKVVGMRLVEGWYRLIYNILAVITLLPALALMVMLPDQVVYSVSMPWALLMLGAQFLGAGGLLAALLVTDLPRFVGLSQVMAFLSGQPLPLPEQPLQQRGMYALVRHPLYLFSLLVIWLTPVMTANILAFNIGATLYVLFGSLIEERRLEHAYGETYRLYRQRVPWLIPLPRRCLKVEPEVEL
jgi:protein-S-isoprenylcysteine O-methyltransferase Ste14